MNAVVSTTFGHNIGDDFIRIGVEKIFRELGPLAPVYYDRNPAQNPQGGNRWRTAIDSGWADAVIIAGSPGWTIEAVPLYQRALAKELPIYMIGIGAASRANLHEQIKNPIIWTALATAKVVIARDGIVGAALGCPVLPCPALLAPKNSPDKNLKFRVLAPGERREQGGRWRHVLAHSINEASKGIYYSDDPAALLGSYSHAESVYTGRLHGAIVAKGAGCPAIETLWPPDDERCVETWKVVQEWTATRDALLSEYLILLDKVRQV